MAVESITIAIPIVVGLIIGIVEAYFVYEDENMTSGRDFVKDMWHGLLFSVFGVLVASNVPYIMTNFVPESFHGFLFVNDQTGASLVVSVIITIFMLVKMVASHQIKGVSGNGFKEKFWHKLMVALLVGFAPYYIVYIRPPIENFVGSWFPSWIPL